MSAPTFVLIPGAWHTPTFYEPWLALFHQRTGVSVKSIALLSVNASNSKEQTLSKDVAEIVSHLKPLLDEGKEIILLCHSFGGRPTGVACRDLDIETRRANGLKGGVIGLIYVAAAVPVAGDNSAARFKQVQGTSSFSEKSYFDAEKGIVGFKDPYTSFYEGELTREEAEPYLSQIGTMSFGPFKETIDRVGYDAKGYDGQRGYVKLALDKCNSLEVQDDRIKSSGVQWETVIVDAGHMAFVTQPEKLIDGVLQLWERFRKP